MFARIFKELSSLKTSSRASRKKNRQATFAQLNVEALEARNVLTSTLYVDFGDNFGTGLNGTIGGLQNTVAPGSNTNVNGPQMDNLTTGVPFADTDPFTMTSFNQIYGGAAASMRASIMSLVRRFYEPLDITVVELTASAQIVNGVSVRGASSLNDVSLTLDANEAAVKDNDCYILVGQMIIGAGNYNPGADGLVGIADLDDLLARSNLRDDTAVITLNGTTWSTELLAFGIAHEGAHNFGLRHTFGNFPSSAPGISSAIHESDIMSYLAGGTFGGFSMFTRYPMVMGDGNTSNNVLSATPTPFDQMANDANIGAVPGTTYITGTGANDIITVTRSGALANITVQAFNDAAYTSSITVPFFGGTTYSYSVSLANPLLIDAGARSDRIVIDASLGQQVLIRGMGGDTGNAEDADQLVISGVAAAATYTPGTNNTLGLDGHTDFRGTVTVGATVVRFQEFDAGSSVRMTGITSVTLQTPLASDSLIFDTVSVSGVVNQRVSGTTGGIFAVPLLFSGATSFILDSATADVGVGDDTVTVSTWVPTILGNVTLNLGAGNDTVFLSAGATAAITTLTVNADAGNDNIIVTAWTPTSLTTVAFNVGTEDDTVTISAPLFGTAITAFALNGNDGNDRLNLNFDNLSLTGGGSIAFNGGNGTDTIGVTNNVTTTTLGTNTVTSSGGGTVNLTAVENAVLTGGAAANSFVVNNLNGSSATIIGGTGTDNLSISQGAVASAVFSPSNSAVNGLSGTVVLPALSLAFSQFEAGSTMTLTGAAAATVQTLGGSDVLTLGTGSAATRSRVTGTTAGIAVAPLEFIGATSFNVDAGNGDTTTGNDTVTVGSLVNSGVTAVVVSTGAGADTTNFNTPFTGSTLQTVTVNGGNENDTLNVSMDSFALAGLNTFTFNGDAGTDAMNITNNAATMTLSTTAAQIAVGNQLNYTTVETASFMGGAAANTYNINSWNGSSLALNGGGGNDIFVLAPATGNLNAVAGGVSVDGGTGTADELRLFDDGAGNALSANYTIGTSSITTVMSNGAARPLTGVTFNATLENILLEGTSVANSFSVTPSTTAKITVDGNAQGVGTMDDLQVDFIGTGGRTLTNQVPGGGTWKFPGSGTPLFGVRQDVVFAGMENFNNQFAMGSAGSVAANTSAPWVKFVDLVSGEVVEFLAYESTFRGGVQVLTADITDATGFGAPDGIPEIITAPGRGRAPEVRVFTSTGVELTRYRQMVYATNNLNGVNIAVGNIDADVFPELIVVPQRGVVEVRVFDIVAGNADPIANNAIYRFNAFPKSFIGGAAVGAGDIDGDGRSEIVVGSGSGTAASVVVFNPAVNFPAVIAPNAATPANPPVAWAKYTGFFNAKFLGGISSVSIGQINGGAADIIVGQGQGGNSLIAMLDGASGRRQVNGSYAATTQAAAQFSAYSDTGNKSAVYAAVRDSDGDGIIDMIFTGQAADGRTKGVIRVFRPTAPFPLGVVPIFGNAQPKGVTVG